MGKCIEGACLGRCHNVRCDAPESACQLPGQCMPEFGKCNYTNVPDGQTCRGGICVAGQCLERDLCLGVVCAPTKCAAAGRCNRVTGLCEAAMARADGTACNDGNPFTLLDTCQSGVCRGVDLCDLVRCDLASQQFQCVSPGTCVRGNCFYGKQPEHSACDDGRDFTVGDHCSATGVCVGDDPCRGVICDSLDQCKVSSCHLGQCVEQPRQDGTVCDDAYGAFTTSDRCRAGVCIGQFRLPVLTVPLVARRLRFGSRPVLRSQATGLFLNYSWHVDGNALAGMNDAFLVWPEPMTQSVEVELRVGNPTGTISSVVTLAVDEPSESDNPPPGNAFVTFSTDLIGLASIEDFETSYKRCFERFIRAIEGGASYLLISARATQGGVRLVFRITTPANESTTTKALFDSAISDTFPASLRACVESSGQRRRSGFSVQSIESGPSNITNFQDPCAGVICNASDACHLPGVCQFGECTDPARPDNTTTCDDGLNETANDMCQAGQCIGTYVPVHCVVSAWSTWSTCATTSPYSSNRTRHVLIPARYGGQDCPALAESRICDPVNCELSSEWGPWSECEPAYPFARHRNRTVLQQGMYGGMPCPSMVNDSASCDPIDCQVSGWQTASNCSRSCGAGEQLETRVVLQASRYGGQPCPPLQRNTSCNVIGCRESHNELF
jgi:hypothetical protein